MSTPIESRIRAASKRGEARINSNESGEPVWKVRGLVDGYAIASSHAYKSRKKGGRGKKKKGRRFGVSGGTKEKEKGSIAARLYRSCRKQIYNEISGGH